MKNKKLSKKEQRKLRNNLTVFQLNMRNSIEFIRNRQARIEKHKQQN